MSNEFINFEKISRESWKTLHQKSKALLTQEEL
ncbi:TPA: type I pantothenate kinase, partial [Streptococcus pyogenes]